MKYRFYSKEFYKRNVSYDKLKLLEAQHRALKIDYEITFPDRSILQCKFR